MLNTSKHVKQIFQETCNIYLTVANGLCWELLDVMKDINDLVA